jgi:hypothetical protein
MVTRMSSMIVDEPLWWACGVPGSRARVDWWPCIGGAPVKLFAAGWQLFYGSLAELDSLTAHDDAPA